MSLSDHLGSQPVLHSQPSLLSDPSSALSEVTLGSEEFRSKVSLLCHLTAIEEQFEVQDAVAFEFEELQVRQEELLTTRESLIDNLVERIKSYPLAVSQKEGGKGETLTLDPHDIGVLHGGKPTPEFLTAVALIDAAGPDKPVDCALVQVPSEHAEYMKNVERIIAATRQTVPLFVVIQEEGNIVQSRFSAGFANGQLECLSCEENRPVHAEHITCHSHGEDSTYYSRLVFRPILEEALISNKFGTRDSATNLIELMPVEGFHPKLKLTPTPLTPLDEEYQSSLGYSNVWVKDESHNPTGSYKDRGIAPALQFALEKGVSEVHVISCGNAALSAGMLAPEVGLDCTCYVTDHISEGKRALLEKFGARVVALPGNYEQVYRQVRSSTIGERSLDITPGINPIGEEGIKAEAYELIHQLGKVPEVIIVPCGNGTHLWQLYKGFDELKQLGYIDGDIPQLVGVQVEGAAPLKAAIDRNMPYEILGDIPDSVAEGIIAQESYSSPKAVHAIIQSGGYIVEVSDKEILSSMWKLRTMKSSLTPEFTSAAAFAALDKMAAYRASKTDDRTIVVMLTGDGKKQEEEIKQALERFAA